ncbi:MAG: chlorite dismutase family protein [Thermoleophilaceae bacterium]
MAQRNFVKFTFIRVLPEWRRRGAEERAQDKREFAAACREFGEDHLLRTYSLVGTRGDCDLMVRSLAPTLDPIHALHVLLNQSGLMRYAEVAHSYLAMTKESVYSEDETPLGAPSRLGRQVPDRLPAVEEARVVPARSRGALADHAGPHRHRSPLHRHRHQHGLLLRARRPGVRGVLQRRRARRVPRPGPGAALDRVQRLHRVRDADLHLHLGLTGAGAGRPGRGDASGRDRHRARSRRRQLPDPGPAKPRSSTESAWMPIPS